MQTRPVTFVLMFVFCVTAQVGAQEPTGAALFEAQCAMCHTPPGVERAPTLEVMGQRSPEAIVAALTDGVMALQALSLSNAQRQAVAEFITGRSVSADATVANAGLCQSTPALVDPLGGPHWSGWGVGGENLRFQTAESAGLDFNQVPNLTLKWAFGFPQSTSAWAQPAVAGASSSEARTETSTLWTQGPGAVTGHIPPALA